MSDFGELLGVFAVFGVAAAVFLLVGVGFYVLKSIGLYTLAERRGIENPWLAWVTIGDLFILGTLVSEMEIMGNRIENLGMISVAVALGGMILSIIPDYQYFCLYSYDDILRDADLQLI